MSQDLKKLCENLTELCQLDIDAVRAYEQALKNIDDSVIASQISSFKADHERHIDELSDTIVRLGEQPPKRTPDLKGFFIEGFTAIRSMTGTEGALKAMRGNEMLTNKTYEKALDWQLPNEIRTLVEKNFSDEKRHLAYIQDVLKSKSWETSARPHL